MAKTKTSLNGESRAFSEAMHILHNVLSSPKTGILPKLAPETLAWAAKYVAVRAPQMSTEEKSRLLTSLCLHEETAKRTQNEGMAERFTRVLKAIDRWGSKTLSVPVNHPPHSKESIRWGGSFYTNILPLLNFYSLLYLTANKEVVQKRVDF